VFEGRDLKTQEVFYRPLGGGIEFGETSYDAAIREIKEELRTDIHHLSYIGCLENIFVSGGKPGHEIIQLYHAEFVDPAIYEQEAPEGFEDDGSPLKVVWKSLESFERGEAPLYPDGLLELLTDNG
jgi:8-oxo-dGTP pyrophosphatase MutT (NUDIX family)